MQSSNHFECDIMRAKTNVEERSHGRQICHQRSGNLYRRENEIGHSGIVNHTALSAIWHFISSALTYADSCRHQAGLVRRTTHKSFPHLFAAISGGSTSLPMKTALLRRLKRLEEVRVVETEAPVEFQMGYLKRLPQEYTGERHVVTVGRAAERRGAPPVSEDGPTSISRIFLVRAKDGRPDYSWPEDAHP
jgi:hypothetical protein